MSVVEAAVHSLRADGWAVLESVVSRDEIERLQAECDHHIQDAETAPDESVYLLTDRPYRINDLILRPRTSDCVLALRAHPQLLDVAQRYVGREFVPYGSVLVYKAPERGPAVPMHTDLESGLFSSDHRWLAVGIYLDEADPGNGCLWVVPGSHMYESDRQHEAIGAGFDPTAGVRPVPMAAGDALFHDARLVHGSSISRSKRPRRVLYFSFQAATWIIREGLTGRFRPDPEWVAKNLEMLQAGSALRSDETPFSWRCPSIWEDRVRAAVDLDRSASIIV